MRTLLLLAIAVCAFGDGGSVILHKRTEQLAVTVFASPAAPRVGPVDMSVLIQSAATLEPVLDATVWLRFAKTGSQTIRVPATHSYASNKLLFSATAQLNEPGEWQVSAEIRAPQLVSEAVVSGSLAIGPEQPVLGAYTGFIALPFIALIVLALQQWLKLRPDRRYAGSARLNTGLGG